MKAKQINGNIQVFSTLKQFSNYTLADGSTVINFHLSDKEVLEAEGFFDYVEKPIGENQKKTAVYFDEENQIYTYDVIDKTPEEINAEYQATIPNTVSQRQLRTQLVIQGINLSNIQTAIDSLQEPDKSIAQIAWDYAVVFERKDPLLIAIASSLNLTESDLEQIYINASKL